MIDLNSVLPWLDLIEPTRLTSKDRMELEGLQDLSLPTRIVTQGIDDALKRIRLSEDIAAYGEALVYCAILEYNRGHKVASIQYLTQAFGLLKSGTHRYAVCGYMLGWLKYDISDIDNAQKYWDLSIKSFEFYIEWYVTQLKQVKFDIQIARSQTIEEVHFWLNKWDPSSLAGQELQLVEILRRKAHRKDLTIYTIMDQLVLLASRNVDYRIEAEGYFECGVAAYQMENYLLSVSYFQSAVDKFHPATHQQAVALWALGLSLWQIATERIRANLTWERTISIFEELSDREAKKNHPDRVHWYEEILNIMRTVITQQYQRI